MKEKKEPRFNGKDLGNNPTGCPGDGFRWKGKGTPESGKGNWIKGNRADGTLEELHPDLHHPPPKPPHWDYFGPDCPDGAELYLDGSWEFKS